jgi:hypothetical protein
LGEEWFLYKLFSYVLMVDPKLERTLKGLVLKRAILGYSTKGDSVVVLYIGANADSELIKKLQMDFPNFTFIIKQIGEIRPL